MSKFSDSHSLTKFLTVAILALCLAGLSGCTGDEDADGEPKSASSPADTDGIVEHDATGVVEAGQVRFIFSVEDSSSALHLVATAPGRRLRLVRLEDPSGRGIYNRLDDADVKYSAAGNFQASPNVFNYPFGDSLSLRKGEYHATYELETTGNPPVDEAALEQVTLRAFSKNDQDVSSGTVNITLFYGDVVSNSKELRDNMDDVVARMQEHLDRAGITGFYKRVNLPELPELLPDPSKGDLLYREMARETGWGINIYFATDADGVGTQLNETVLAGSSPGALVAGNRSAIVVSVSRAAGSDGRFDGEDREQFDDSEFDILADNLAHEVFHYLGLSDSVTFRGENVVSTDGLDTEKCSTETACQDNRGANENVMFPYALRIEDAVGDQFFARYRVSDQQRTFANHHIAVD